MSVLREIAARFGIEFDDGPLKRGTESISEGVEMLKTLSGVLAGAEIVRGVREFVESFTEAGAQVQQTADMLGIGTQELQALQFAAGQAGIGAERFNGALTRLNVSIDAARQGSGPAAEAFRALGVHITDAHGVARPLGEVLDDLSSGFSRIEDPSRRTGIAVDIFGRAGARMVNVLHDGEGGLAEMREEFERLGGGMTEEGVRSAEEYERATRRQDVAFMALKSTIANAILPIFTRVTDWITGAIASFKHLTQGTHVVELGLGALALVAMRALYPAILNLARGSAMFLAEWAPLLLAVAAAVLIFDDLWALFHGGHSVIGTLIDDFAGLGASQHFVQSLREAWEGVKLALHDVQVLAGHLWDNVTSSVMTAVHDVEAGWNRLLDFLDPSRVARRQREAALMASGVQYRGRNGQTYTIHAGEGVSDEFSSAKSRAEGARRRSVSALATPGGLSINSGLLETWASIFSPARPTTTPAGFGSYVRYVTSAPVIHIHGVHDARAAGREVDRALRDHDRRIRDASHPLTQRGDE